MATALERQLKRFGLFGLSRLATSPRTGPGESDLAGVRRILVVRPDERIGNAILIIPLLNALKQRFPKAHLALVMSRRYWELREFIPSVDEFIAFDKKHYARNPLAFVGFVRRLRRAGYDLVFDASGDHSVSFTHLAITAYSGGKFRIGHDRGEAAKCYDVAVPVSTVDRHETERHLDLLRVLSKVEVDPRPLLKPVQHTRFAETLWSSLGWKHEKATVVIHPGARGRKRWSASNFAAVANRLTESGVQVGVLWGPADSIAADEMLSQSSSSVKRLGILTFREFIAVVRQSDVFFSGDCGPMHVAAATPPLQGVVTVFTIDKGRRYIPLGIMDEAIVDDSGRDTVDDAFKSILWLTSRRAEAHFIKKLAPFT